MKRFAIAITVLLGCMKHHVSKLLAVPKREDVFRFIQYVVSKMFVTGIRERVHILDDYQRSIYFGLREHDVILKFIEPDNIQTARMSFDQAKQLISGAQRACEERIEVEVVVDNLGWKIDARSRHHHRVGIKFWNEKFRFPTGVDRSFLEKGLNDLSKRLTEIPNQSSTLGEVR